MKPSLAITSVRLRVAQLSRALEFYVGRLGFVAVRTTAADAELATSTGGPVLLHLVQDAAAPAAPPDAAGLFHAALLFPDRAALGGWLRHAAAQNLEFDGFSDHGVSEATYFSDPDGNGLEFYADKPRGQWPFAGGELAMVTRPLDVRSVLAAGRDPGAEPLAGARWGHLHLRVTDLERSDRYYRELLGMQLMQGTFPGARFLAADGYHHHFGLNSWGRPIRPQPEGSLGLAEATVAVAGAARSGITRDPDGLALRIATL